MFKLLIDHYAKVKGFSELSFYTFKIKVFYTFRLSSSVGKSATLVMLRSGVQISPEAFHSGSIIIYSV